MLSDSFGGYPSHRQVGDMPRFNEMYFTVNHKINKINLRYTVNNGDHRDKNMAGETRPYSARNSSAFAPNIPFGVT
jgi:hypothetical protein